MTPAPTTETIARVLAKFNGGIVRVPDASNARGFVSYYRPVEAMKAALEEFLGGLANQDADQKPVHWSDCALHHGPAETPGPCSCGVDPSMTPERYGSEWPS